ncbi:uncharacterized protein LOC130636986 [Hydractinia symbiolongicarpus]|uniref:uncharacterized protein LOC130636986 n=1 Tax=Hydractinia symbiolongicarpus TaxID=13093 RepID=UPI00254FCBFF|nr:uncharacterized protein LOC130636986 [Hydractinia symbiolongicarpus]
MLNSTTILVPFLFFLIIKIAKEWFKETNNIRKMREANKWIQESLLEKRQSRRFEHSKIQKGKYPWRRGGSKPFKVKNLAQVESSVDSSVTVRWLHIPSNETGDPSQGESFLLRYELVWWDKSIGRIQNQTIKDLGLPGTLEQNRYYYKRDGYVYYTLRDLDIKSQYGIVVYGVNRLGKGEETNVNTDFRPKNAASKTDDGDNMIGIVIGAVLGGIIVLVLVIVFIVWCSKRSDASKRYPASYVEEAVDYPPNQGHSLYAGVEKKQKVVSRSDSTSGYPDVVGNGNDYSMKPRNSSSYEPSNKAFV